MSAIIANVEALEVLDSRGNPTLQVTIQLEGGRVVSASVPSGASTGQYEAHELRDNDPSRYDGRGVLNAVRSVEEKIAPMLCGLDATFQQGIDRMMIELDGTSNKSNLGANAIIGVSMAVARAGAAARRLPLYTYLAGLTDSGATPLPVPMMNVINGGKHAQNKLDFQEFMIVPHGARTFREALQFGCETYAALRKILARAGYATGVGDEGGFAPDLPTNERACALIVEAIQAAGFEPGRQISIALDPAASSFFKDDRYHISTNGPLTGVDLGALYAGWRKRFPIVSIEDGFDETDWASFETQTRVLGADTQIVGDDLYVTNPQFIKKGIARAATNAVLIKLNQIGTVTETIEAIEECRHAGWAYVISHRSGETEDTFIADFAVAMGGGQIKTGAPCRAERTAKYNRLLCIEAELGKRAKLATPFARDLSRDLSHV